MMSDRTGRAIASFAVPALMICTQFGTGRAQLPMSAPASAATAAAVTLPHISVTSIGTGSPVVLIPGLSSPRAVWDGVAPALARSHRVILVQVNGFGGDAPGANLSPGLLDGIVADLDRYLTDAKLPRADIVGHSMGGLVAMMMARAHPDRVGKLMIVDSLPYIGEIFVPGATVAMLQPQAVMLRDKMAAQYGKPRDAAADAGTAAGMAVTPAARATVTRWIAQADPRVSGQAFYEDMTTDLRPVLPSIAAPITLVYPWSATLPKVRADGVYRAAYAKAPRVTFVDVPDSGHFVMLDQPAAFAAALQRWLH